MFYYYIVYCFCKRGRDIVWTTLVIFNYFMFNIFVCLGKPCDPNSVIGSETSIVGISSAVDSHSLDSTTQRCEYFLNDLDISKGFQPEFEDEYPTSDGPP